ncbi:MAG: hypothetical protein BWY86_01506 [Candidatus Aminicenantes bacterium ADurb.Bin508]|nr:MAG: hypothetical protein BWY86_01506 [Candidatus Aminicenantes bacterium ADurb.Bin508]
MRVEDSSEGDSLRVIDLLVTPLSGDGITRFLLERSGPEGTQVQFPVRMKEMGAVGADRLLRLDFLLHDYFLLKIVSQLLRLGGFSSKFWHCPSPFTSLQKGKKIPLKPLPCE